MSISSIASTFVQLNQPSRINSGERIEGNKPDGDGDQDDLSQSSSVNVSTASTQVGGNIGTNINVVA